MALPVENGPAARGLSPRIVNVIIGVWLFISAFVWPHTREQMNNTWICGVLCVGFALAGMAIPWVRYLNTLLAIWIFISAWALRSLTPGTVWNNVLCAIAIFIVSLVPSVPTSTTPGVMMPGRTAPPRAA
jgi:hypothetical protein